MSGNAPIDLGSQTLTVGSDNTSKTYSGIISDGGNLLKTGSGILVLNAQQYLLRPGRASSAELCTCYRRPFRLQAQLPLLGALDPEPDNVLRFLSSADQPMEP